MRNHKIRGLRQLLYFAYVLTMNARKSWTFLVGRRRLDYLILFLRFTGPSVKFMAVPLAAQCPAGVR